MRRSKARSWTLKVGAALVVGVVVTWVVAWGCALWAPMTWGNPDGSRGAFPPETFIAVPSGWAQRDQFERRLIVWSESSAFGVVVRTCLMDSLDDDVFVRRRWVYEISTGWPLACLHSRVEADAPRGKKDNVIAVGAMAETPGWLRPRTFSRFFPHRLPCRILSFGFAVNTLMAAGVLIGATDGVRASRRWMRRRKGLCVQCGYERAGVVQEDLCPECGRAGV
jgi:hypothetical protein